MKRSILATAIAYSLRHWATFRPMVGLLLVLALVACSGAETRPTAPAATAIGVDVQFRDRNVWVPIPERLTAAPAEPALPDDCAALLRAAASSGTDTYGSMWCSAQRDSALLRMVLAQLAAIAAIQGSSVQP